MTPTHRLHTRFTGDTLQVTDYTCDGHERGRSGEEATASHEIVFPRAGAFMRHNAWGNVLLDLNHVLFFQRGQPYQVSHPVAGGDISTIFAVRDDVLFDMVREQSDQPFRAGHALIEPHLRLRLGQLLHADSPDDLYTEEQMLLFLGDVIGSTVGTAPTASGATAAYHRELAENIKVVLAARWHEPLRLADIAQATHASSYFLCRVFAAHIGLSIHQYLIRLRLMHALEYLNADCDNLAVLALDLGFSSQSHFTAAFKRAFGRTPTAYRPKILNKNPQN